MNRKIYFLPKIRVNYIYISCVIYCLRNNVFLNIKNIFKGNRRYMNTCDTFSPCLLIRCYFEFAFTVSPGLGLKHMIPVIEIRVTSARDYRAGRPTHEVLSEAGRRCPFHLKNTQQREGLTIFPFRRIHIRTREIRRCGRSVCRRRRSRMTSFLLIAGVGGRARGLPLDSYVRHAIPRL